MILTNHLGYDANGTKHAVFQGKGDDNLTTFKVLNADGNAVFNGTARKFGSVEGWNTGYYYVMDFTELKTEGQHTVEAETASGVVRSQPFEISDYLITMRTMNAAVYYFKAQRCTGEWNDTDSRITFLGDREGSFDARGGWYDASGDYSIHLSHLSHGSYFNPQQTAFCGYALINACERLSKNSNVQYTMIKRRLLDEGTFGADFIMRMRAPSGTFFRSILRSDALEHVRRNRRINFEYRGSSNQFAKADTADSEVIKDENYEVSLRSGGGLCIATLAAASRHYYPGTAFSRDEYIRAAQDAWHYLEKNNTRYTNDGKWNLIDEYCSLIALTELYKATEEYEYLEKATKMAEKIISKVYYSTDGNAYLTVNGERLFYHPSDEGMPVVALLEYAQIEPRKEKSGKAIDIAEKLMCRYLAITNTDNNPFGYAKMTVTQPDGSNREGYFMPHNTEVAPWWQGENARIESLACAAFTLAQITADNEFAAQLRAFGDNQLNWVLGLNPYDSCMMNGFGRNNIEYFFKGRYDFLACPAVYATALQGLTTTEQALRFIKSHASKPTITGVGQSNGYPTPLGLYLRRPQRIYKRYHTTCPKGHGMNNNNYNKYRRHI